jgi:hypothetical protein
MNRKMQKYLFTILILSFFLISCSPQTTVWEGIPIIDNGQEFYTPERTDLKAYAYTVTLTPKEAEQFYKDQMPSLGWNLFDEQKQEAFGEQSKMLFYGKGLQTLTIDFSATEGRTYIGFVLYE